MSSRAFDKEKKRREIAIAAMAVFADRGFEATSIREIAKKAGVGKGTVYEYFRSKEELIATSIQVWMEQIIMQVETLVTPIDDPEVKLRKYIDTIVDKFLEDEQIPRLILSIFQLFMTRLQDTTFGEVVQSMFTTGVDSISGILVEGINRGIFRFDGPEEARIIAVNMVAYLDGLCIDYIVTGRSFNLKEQVDHYVNYLLRENMK